MRELRATAGGALAALLLLLLVLLPLPASAVEANGYLESRLQGTVPRTDGLLSSEDVPALQAILEGNVQLKQPFGEQSFLLADLSLFAQAAGRYRGEGGEVIPAHDVPATRPQAVLFELYVSHEVVPALSLLAGKKRVVWGSGLAYNPTDLLNPPKDPTDPLNQRAGAWMARVEVPLESSTFTLLASPMVTAEASGIPRAFVTYPEWDRKDDEAHFLLAARAYALVADSDLNLMAFYGNRYPDDFSDKLRFGASFSRYFFTDYELHVEALLQQGSPRSYPVHGCVEDLAAVARCAAGRRPPASQSRIDDGTVLPRILTGARTMFPDETSLSLEYLFQADGLTPAQLQDQVALLGTLREARRAGLGGFSPDGGEVDPTLQKFSFVPLGRHYLFLSLQKPRIRDDFTLQLVLIESLADLSGLASPSVSWSATEWATLTLSAFLPFRGPASLAATEPGSGDPVSEYTLLPFEYRGLLSARLFY